MSGFAGALTEGIKERRARKADREDDIFKMSYQSYLSNKEDMKAMREKDKAAAANAEMLAATTDNPEESYKVIYQALKNGVDAKFLEETLRENKIKLIDTPKAPKAPSTDTAAVDSQMAGAMMDTSKTTTSQPAVQSTPVETAPVAETKSGVVRPENWFAEMFSNETADPTRYRDAAVQKISEATGEDPKMVSKIITGEYRPNEPTEFQKFVFQKKTKPEEAADMADAQLNYNIAKENGDKVGMEKWQRHITARKMVKAEEARLTAIANGKNVSPFAIIKDGKFAGTINGEYKQGEDGNQVLVNSDTGEPVTDQVKRVEPDFNKEYLKQAKEVDTLAAPYLEKSSTFIESLSIADTIVRATKDTPAITNYRGSLSAAANTLINNTTGVLGFVKSELNKDVSEVNFKLVGDSLNKIEDTLLLKLSPENQDIAEKAKAYEAMLDVLAFKFAAMEKQTGKEVSDKDFTRFRGAVGVKGDTPETIKKRLDQFLFEKAKTLQGDYNNITNSGIVKSFKLLEGFDMGVLPMSVEEQMAGVPGRENAIEYYNSLLQNTGTEQISQFTVAPDPVIIDGIKQRLKPDGSNAADMKTFLQRKGMDPSIVDRLLAESQSTDNITP